AGAGLLCLLAHVGKHLGIDIVDEFHLSSGLGADLLKQGFMLGSGSASNTRKLGLDAVSQPLESEKLQRVAPEPRHPLKKVGDSATDSIDRVRDGELDRFAHLAEKAADPDGHRVQATHEGDAGFLDELELFA